MGYLDGTSVTVDAVLTKKGREILSKGQQLNISSFTCTDEGVDYTLWNADHPSGSAFYGEAIENMPMLEATVHSEYALKNRLLSLNQNTIAMPALEMNGLNGTNTLTFEDGDTGGFTITATRKGFANTGNNMGIYFVIIDPDIIKTGTPASRTLSGNNREFLREQDFANAKEYRVTGPGPDFGFTLMPDTEQLKKGRETMVYVVDIEVGAYTFFKCINNVERLSRKVLSAIGTKG